MISFYVQSLFSALKHLNSEVTNNFTNKVYDFSLNMLYCSLNTVGVALKIL